MSRCFSHLLPALMCVAAPLATGQPAYSQPQPAYSQQQTLDQAQLQRLPAPEMPQRWAPPPVPVNPAPAQQPIALQPQRVATPPVPVGVQPNQPGQPNNGKTGPAPIYYQPQPMTQPAPQKSQQPAPQYQAPSFYQTQILPQQAPRPQGQALPPANYPVQGAATQGSNQRYATQAIHNPTSAQQSVMYTARQEIPPTPRPPMPPPEVVPVPVPQPEAVRPVSQSFYTLDQLTSIAERQNPILERSDAEIESAMGERVQAALYPNPRFETNNPEVFAGQNSTFNFGFQQDLVTKGKIRLDKAAADQLVRSETAGYNVDRAQMLTEVRLAYVQCLAMRQRVLLAQYLVKMSGQSVSVARQLQKAGEGSLTDVLLLESEYQRSLADLDNSRALLEGEYKQLAAVTGVPDLLITEVDGSIFQTPPEFNEPAIRNFVANNSALIERMQAEIIRSQVLLRRAEVEAYPNIRVGPAYQSGTQAGFSQFWLSVVFDIPVWDLNQGNIRKAQAKVRGSHADMEVNRNELLRQTAEKFARYKAAKGVADRIQTSILPNSQQALSLVQDGFSKGQFDVNRVLQAQRVLSDVAREHIEASEKAWTGAAELGGLIQLEYFPLQSQPLPPR